MAVSTRQRHAEANSAKNCDAPAWVAADTKDIMENKRGKPDGKRDDEMEAWVLRDCIGPSDYVKLEFLLLSKGYEANQSNLV